MPNDTPRKRTASLDEAEPASFGRLAAALPPDENDRVAALHRAGILDTPAEPAFDRLAHLAARLFDAPIALISLIDAERQWFKARVGLDVSETPRAISFCAHAILSDDVFVVRDALADPRFCENPLVRGPPHIRFYAGAPLVTAEGFRLGTINVIDRVKRQDFAAVDEKALADIAAIAVDALSLRRANAALARERKRLEEEARRRAKMVALGTLASGIAHDFNNLLLGLEAAIERCRDELPSGSAGRRPIALALDGIQHGRALVRQIKSFARTDGLRLAPARLDEAVRRAADLLEATVPSSVRLDRRIAAVGNVLIDPTQIQRVVFNLVLNAVDAISERAGVVAITLERIDIDAGAAAERGLAAAGPYACLSVRDDGSGMSVDERERAFEPFFSTKAEGDAVGLGLSVVRSIVAEHGGSISVESEPGAGSCFSIYLRLVAPSTI